MKKTVAAVVAALAIAFSAVGAIAADNKTDRPKTVDPPVAVTSVPAGGPPQIPGKPNRKRVPVPAGQDTTHTTGTVVRFQ